jgi:hypothetical protein
MSDIPSEVITQLLSLRGYTPNVVEGRKLKELDLRARKGHLKSEDVLEFVQKKDKNLWKHMTNADYRDLGNIDL